MGYLSQKKHQIRENIFLYTSAFIFGGLGIFSVMFPGFKVGFFNLFHLYLLSFIFTIYSVWVKKYKPAIIFCFIFIVSYTTLGSSVNLFIPDKFIGNSNVELKFIPNTSLSKEFIPDNLSSGAVVLANEFIVPYVIINKGSPLTIIRVDLRQASHKQYPLIFEHLHQFIVRQDNPVIIYGEFGIPAWSKVFKQFLSSSGLSVKNSLIFTQSSRYNIFTTPGFYILGFHDMGVSDVRISNLNGHKVISAQASFNLAHP